MWRIRPGSSQPTRRCLRTSSCARGLSKVRSSKYFVAAVCLCFPRRDQRLGWARSFQRRSGSSPIPIASELCHLAVMCFSCALPSLSCTRLSPFLDKRRVPLAVVLFSPLGEEIGSRLWRVARFCRLRGAWKRGVFLGRCQESRSELAPDQGGRAVTVVVCQNFGDKMGVCLSKFS